MKNTFNKHERFYLKFDTHTTIHILEEKNDFITENKTIVEGNELLIVVVISAFFEEIFTSNFMIFSTQFCFLIVSWDIPMETKSTEKIIFLVKKFLSQVFE